MQGHLCSALYLTIAIIHINLTVVYEMEKDMTEKHEQSSISRLLGTSIKWAGGLAGAWAVYSALAVDHNMRIGLAVDSERHEFLGKRSTFLSYYTERNGNSRPIVLLHGINAAASAYEIKPLFEWYRIYRPVYALDLPGFGFSERTNRDYTVDLYCNAIEDLLDLIGEPVDIVALSLSSEFVAQVAQKRPDDIHSITMISPTGFSRQSDSNIDTMSGVGNLLSQPLWAQPLYDLLVSQSGLRYFLSQHFEQDVPNGLLKYAWLTSHQSGARFAPLSFISGKLFTRNVYQAVYQQLNVPTLVLFDSDPNTDFGLLPEILEQSDNWYATRIPRTRGLPHFERLNKVTNAIDAFWEKIG